MLLSRRTAVKGKDGASSLLRQSACIVAAQFVMIPVAILTGKLTGQQAIISGALLSSLYRILYTLGKGAVYLIAVQSLDGVGAAIFGVLWVIIISDLAKGTGRFNLLQGAIQAALGVGAFLSNFLAGFVVKSLGYNAGFLGLAGIASIGLVFSRCQPGNKRSEHPQTVTPSPKGCANLSV